MQNVARFYTAFPREMTSVWRRPSPSQVTCNGYNASNEMVLSNIFSIKIRFKKKKSFFMNVSLEKKTHINSKSRQTTCCILPLLFFLEGYTLQLDLKTKNDEHLYIINITYFLYFSGLLRVWSLRQKER